MRAEFIYFLNWGVQGAALATACSQGLAALLTVRHLCSMKTGYRLRLGRMKLGKAICKEFLTVGIPSAVQSVVITLWNRLHHLVLPMTIVVLEHLWYYAYLLGFTIIIIRSNRQRFPKPRLLPIRL